MQYPVNDQSMSMTSLEIADLVEKRHDNVKRTIETLIEKGVITSPQIEEKPTAGRPMSIYVFEGEQGKRDSIVVVAQLSPEFTAKLVDRWQELEKSINQPIRIPQTLPEALRLAADLAEQKAQLETKLAIAAPKAEFVDSYVEASGSMGFRETAKLLKVKETDFRLFLIDHNIMYRLAGKLTPYAPHISAGRFTVKTGEADNGHAFTQVKFTPKGIQWIAGLLAVANIDNAA
ncbi:phage antirepressor KilAC domain-containing protein [Pectobacterium aroidearum]|uniref:phage antirepressor KilAC domain-containing protein n=1 Tax=Pectobacterium aroidearum TaxID=1201031 RepID=UPI003158A58D